MQNRQLVPARQTPLTAEAAFLFFGLGFFFACGLCAGVACACRGVRS